MTPSPLLPRGLLILSPRGFCAQMSLMFHVKHQTLIFCGKGQRKSGKAVEIPVPD